MDRFALVQVIHWTVYISALCLLYVAFSALFREKLGRVARGATSLAVCSISFILIEAVLLSLPSKGVVFYWKVGAAGDFYIYVLFLLISGVALAATLLRFLIARARG